MTNRWRKREGRNGFNNWHTDDSSTPIEQPVDPGTPGTPRPGPLESGDNDCSVYMAVINPRRMKAARAARPKDYGPSASPRRRNVGARSTTTQGIDLFDQIQSENYYPPLFVPLSSTIVVDEAQTGVVNRVPGSGGRGPLFYQLLPVDDYQNFSVNSATGDISPVSAFDYESGDTRQSISVSVTDGVDAYTVQLDVVINAVDEVAPVFVAPASPLNVPADQLLMTPLVVTDTDLGENITFDIVGGADAALFLVTNLISQPKQALLTSVNALPARDYVLNVRAKGKTLSSTIELTISAVADPVVIADNQTMPAARDNWPVGQYVGSVAFTGELASASAGHADFTATKRTIGGVQSLDVFVGSDLASGPGDRTVPITAIGGDGQSITVNVTVPVLAGEVAPVIDLTLVAANVSSGLADGTVLFTAVCDEVNPDDSEIDMTMPATAGVTFARVNATTYEATVDQPDFGTNHEGNNLVLRVTADNVVGLPNSTASLDVQLAVSAPAGDTLGVESWPNNPAYNGAAVDAELGADNTSYNGAAVLGANVAGGWTEEANNELWFDGGDGHYGLKGAGNCPWNSNDGTWRIRFECYEYNAGTYVPHAGWDGNSSGNAQWHDFSGVGWHEFDVVPRSGGNDCFFHAYGDGGLTLKIRNITLKKVLATGGSAGTPSVSLLPLVAELAADAADDTPLATSSATEPGASGHTWSLSDTHSGAFKVSASGQVLTASQAQLALLEGSTVTITVVADNGEGSPSTGSASFDISVIEAATVLPLISSPADGSKLQSQHLEITFDNSVAGRGLDVIVIDPATGQKYFDTSGLVASDRGNPAVISTDPASPNHPSNFGDGTKYVTGLPAMPTDNRVLDALVASSDDGWNTANESVEIQVYASGSAPQVNAFARVAFSAINASEGAFVTTRIFFEDASGNPVTSSQDIVVNASQGGTLSPNDCQSGALFNATYTMPAGHSVLEITDYIVDDQVSESNESLVFTITGAENGSFNSIVMKSGESSATLNVSDAAVAAGIRYVATDGNDSAAGTDAAPWRTIRHANLNTGEGFVTWIKAGVYTGSANVLDVTTPGSEGAPRIFAGYQNTPGDTPMYPRLPDDPRIPWDVPVRFDLNTEPDPTLQPVLDGGSRSSGGTRIRIRASHVHVLNMTLINCVTALIVDENVTNYLIRNINTKDHGATTGSSYSGNGFRIYGSYGVIEDSACNEMGGQGWTIGYPNDDSDIGNHNIVRRCTVTAGPGNDTNSTDYPFVCRDGNDNVFENCYIRRVGSPSHGYHGFSVKTGKRNTFRRCVAVGVKLGAFKTWYQDANDNLFEDCMGLDLVGGWGVGSVNGSFGNEFKRITIHGARQAMVLSATATFYRNDAHTTSQDNLYEDIVADGITDIGILFNGYGYNTNNSPNAICLDTVFRRLDFKAASPGKYLMRIESEVLASTQFIDCTFRDWTHFGYGARASSFAAAHVNSTEVNCGFDL